MGSDPVQIPDRPLFKATEVCEIAQLQPYVLRSWEAEFGALGVDRPGGGRVYRRADLERVLEIRRLVFEEGLTVAGAKRRLAAEAPAVLPDVETLLDEDARGRVRHVQQGLRDLLAVLDGAPPRAAAPSDGVAGGRAARQARAAGEPVPAVAARRLKRSVG